MRWLGNFHFGWFVFKGRIFYLFLPIISKECSELFLRWILDLINLSKLINLLLLDLGLNIYYSCFKADGTRRKTHWMLLKVVLKTFPSTAVKNTRLHHWKFDEIRRPCIRPTEALRQRNLLFLSLEILDLCLLREIRAWQRTWLSWSHPVFGKLRFRFLRPCTLTHKASLFKFLQFEKHFEKLSYLDGDWCGRRPKRRNKAAFSNFSGLVWNIKLLYSTLLRYQLMTNYCKCFIFC